MEIAKEHQAVGDPLMQYILDHVDSWMKPETKTAEALVWGTGGSYSWELPTNQARIAATSPLTSGDPPSILPSSVRISAVGGGLSLTAEQLDMIRNGVDFTVEFDSQRMNWILTANDSVFYSSGHTIQVSYEWNYRRLRGNDAADDVNVPVMLVSEFG
jgi:hypothetical protein